jgi:uncharacterized protein YjbJ (UPF0337 family)
MKPSMKDKIKGGFHEVKETIKEEVGKGVTNNRNLKAKGRAADHQSLATIDHWKTSFRLCHVVPLWSLMKRPGTSPPEQPS